MAVARKVNRKYVGKPSSFQKLSAAVDRAQRRSADAKAEYVATAFSMIVAKQLLDARKKAGLTQGQVAARARIPQSFIARLENPNSSKRPSLGTIAKVAEALNVRKLVLLTHPPKARVSRAESASRKAAVQKAPRKSGQSKTSSTHPIAAPPPQPSRSIAATDRRRTMAEYVHAMPLGQ